MHAEVTIKFKISIHLIYLKENYQSQMKNNGPAENVDWFFEFFITENGIFTQAIVVAEWGWVGSGNICR